MHFKKNGIFLTYVTTALALLNIILHIMREYNRKYIMNDNEIKKHAKQE